ncbi:unnamed protein product [Orchesella dallaii]|uniref:Uncharacterized protein n=1 Tax=Orchesella dallaii TaxID=48710 RepID=A0ABP1S7J7_9HEXA
MVTHVSEKARKTARAFGWWYLVLNTITLLLVAYLTVALLGMGYQLYNFEDEEQVSDGTLSAFVHEKLYDRSDEEIMMFFGLYGTFPLGLFAIAAPQHYGAYLLLQATKIDSNPSEALVKVNIHHKIQIANLFLDAFFLYLRVFVNTHGLLPSSLILVVLILIRAFGIGAVSMYRKELSIAAANYGKKTEKEKQLENKAKEAEEVSISVPE